MIQQEQISQKTTIVKQVQKNINQSKKTHEFIFKLMYLFATVFSAILLRKVYYFQTLPEYQGIRMGSFWDFFYYSIPFGILFTILDLLAHYFLDNLCQKYYVNEEKYEGKAKQKRAYTIVKWGYSTIYYMISSTAAYCLLKNTHSFPTWLGGNGSCTDVFRGVPALPQGTQGMKIYYLFQLGKHIGRLFLHMFVRSQGNYYEYVLHHALSTFLILFSYLTNQWLVGIMVLLCHDASDLVLTVGRGYKDYKHYSKIVVKIMYAFVFIIWISGRLIIFPICCVYPALMVPTLMKQTLTLQQLDILLLPFRWMGYMLVGLQALQIFWTYYLSKGFITFSNK